MRRSWRILVSSVFALAHFFPIASPTSLHAGPQEEGEDEATEVRTYDIGWIFQAVAFTDSPFLVRPRGDLVFNADELTETAFGDERLRLVPPASDEFGNTIDLGGDSTTRESRRDSARQMIDAIPNIYDTSPTFHGSSMAMQGTRETHNTIAATLAALRRATEARARIEFLIVPTAELDRVVPAWREEGPYLDGASFDALLAEPDARLLTLSAPLGRWATSGSQGRDTLLSDYSINQTGVIPVADPVLATERSGEVLHVRLARIPGMADRLSAEVALGVYELESEAERVGDDWADLTLPRVRELLFSTTAVVPSGRPVVLGSAPGESGGVVLLRATMPVDRVRDDRPPPEARLVDAAFLGRSDESDRAWWGIEAPLDHGKWNFDPFELLSPVLTTNEVDQLRAEIWPLTGHVILVRPSAETAGRIDTFLATESKRRARTAQVEIELLSVTRETYAAMRQLAEPDSALDPKWREAVARGPDSEIRRYGIVGISGETHAVRAAEIRTLLTGGESVSGGTGFAIVQFVDPTTATCGSGVELRARVEFSAEEDSAHLRIEGADTAIEEIRKVTARFPVVRTTPTGEMDGGPENDGGAVPPTATQEIELQLPKQSVSLLRIDRSLPLDRHVLLEAKASAGGKVDLVVARVRRVE